jgi:hypothetical protein
MYLSGCESQTNRGCEPVARLAITDEYSATQRLVNPLDSVVFPVLSGIASSYERFRFKRLRLRYETGCPSTTAGQVALAWQVSPLDAVPQSLVEALSYEESTGGSVANNHLAQFRRISGRTDGDDEWYYTDPDDSLADPTKRFQGALIWALEGGTATAALPVDAGILWLEYEVELSSLRPRQESAVMGWTTTDFEAPTGVSNWNLGEYIRTHAGHWFDGMSSLAILDEYYDPQEIFRNSEAILGTGLAGRLYQFAMDVAFSAATLPGTPPTAEQRMLPEGSFTIRDAGTPQFSLKVGTVEVSEDNAELVEEIPSWRTCLNRLHISDGLLYPQYREVIGPVWMQADSAHLRPIFRLYLRVGAVRGERRPVSRSRSFSMEELLARFPDMFPAVDYLKSLCGDVGVENLLSPVTILGIARSTRVRLMPTTAGDATITCERYDSHGDYEYNVFQLLSSAGTGAVSLDATAFYSASASGVSPGDFFAFAMELDGARNVEAIGASAIAERMDNTVTTSAAAARSLEHRSIRLSGTRSTHSARNFVRPRLIRSDVPIPGFSPSSKGVGFTKKPSGSP